MNTRHLIGKQYKLPNGITFTLTEVKSYPKAEVSSRYKDILAFKPGYLVAISYRRALIPNITLEAGVARIMAVDVNGTMYKRPHAISMALGIKDDMSSYPIKEVK